MSDEVDATQKVELASVTGDRGCEDRGVEKEKEGIGSKDMKMPYEETAEEGAQMKRKPRTEAPAYCHSRTRRERTASS